MSQDSSTKSLYPDTWSFGRTTSIMSFKVIVQFLAGAVRTRVCDLLETETPGLFEQEPASDSNDEIKEAPEQECPVSHVGDHVWRGDAEDL